jgi:predicted HTH transcriptional regulator
VLTDPYLKQYFDVFLFEILPANQQNPQRFCLAAVVKCSHYYGTDETRPIPSHQVFGRTLFAQTTESIDFVLSKLNRTLGGRENATVADTKLEIPKEAVREIIVNAVVHRDYDSSGSVQVTVFSDRVEIINPGTLPEGLTVEDLAKRHISIPVNPFLARPFYLVGYINQLGYGTENVVKWCRKAGLPEPTFEQLNQQFCVTIWRNWLTRDRLGEFNLNLRQADAIRYLQEHRRINNTKYQEVTGVAKRTALRDLKQLMELGLIERIGTTGKGTYYILSKGAIKGPKGPRAGFSSKRNKSKS